MVSLNPPVCDFGWKAPDFNLLGVDGRHWSLADIAGPKGLLVMFICNHCPYVQAIRERLVEDLVALKSLGVNAVAISSNDAANYPERVSLYRPAAALSRQARGPQPGGRGVLNRPSALWCDGRLTCRDAAGHRFRDLDAVHTGRQDAARIAGAFAGRVQAGRVQALQVLAARDAQRR